MQLDLLDHYAGAEALAARVRDAYRTWRSAADTLHALETKVEQSRDRRTLLEYQLGELSDLAVSPGEYEELHDRYRRMSKSQDIQTRIGTALGVLEGESESGAADVARIVTLLAGIDDGHASLASARELLDTALTHLDETSRELRRYLDELTSAPDELERIEARLDRITELARKHRLRPEMLAERHSELTAELGSLSVSDQDLDAVRQTMLDAEQTFRTAGAELSSKRRRAAKKFAREVSTHIDSLGITGGSLQLVFADAEHEGGLDSVEYHIVTNPKYPAAPLARIASGGERSRVSLAIQVVAAEKSGGGVVPRLSANRSWSPTERRGLSDEFGSWKTICSRRRWRGHARA